VLGVPGAGVKRDSEPVDDALLHVWLEQRPHRLGAANSRVEELLGSPPKRLEESVEAVAGRWDSLHARAPTQGSGDVVDSGEPWSLLHEPLVEELLLPDGQIVELEREDHYWSAGDAAKLGQAGVDRIPVMDRHTGHRRIDRAIIDGKRLCTSGDRRRGASGALSSHGRARLDGEHPTIARLIRPGAGTDVEHRACVAKRGMNMRGNPRIRAPMLRIRAPMPLIVDPSSH